MNGTITVRKAAGDDRPAIDRLLKSVGLASDDIEFDNSVFFIAEAGDVPVGTIGLELYGGTGLLRSAAVLPGWQNRGIGDRLVGAVIDESIRVGMNELVLLTETAADYFLRKGFKGIAREEVGGEILTSSQFRGACPQSARVMRKKLQHAAGS